METSNLIPFVRSNLHILFVGLNPARGSSLNRHYFSVNQSFWNQLYDAGLINSKVDKSNADTLIFGGNRYNYRLWEYGITDLVTAVAESDSSKVKPSLEDCKALSELIQEKFPKVAILLHSKVCKYFLSFLGCVDVCPLRNTTNPVPDEININVPKPPASYSLLPTSFVQYGENYLESYEKSTEPRLSHSTSKLRGIRATNSKMSDAIFQHCVSSWQSY